MSIFKKVIDWVEAKLGIAAKSLETVVIPAAIAVGNVAKTLFGLDTNDAIGKIFGAIGVVLEDKLKNILPAVILKLQLAQQYAGQNLDPNTILSNILRLLGTAPVVTQTAFVIELTGLIGVDLQDDKLSLGEIQAIIKMVYDNQTAIQQAQAGDGADNASADTEATTARASMAQGDVRTSNLVGSGIPQGPANNITNSKSSNL